MKRVRRAINDFAPRCQAHEAFEFVDRGEGWPEYEAASAPRVTILLGTAPRMYIFIDGVLAGEFG